MATRTAAITFVGSGSAFGLYRQSAGRCFRTVGLFPTRYLVLRVFLPAVKFFGLLYHNIGVTNSLALRLFSQSDFVIRIGVRNSSRPAVVVAIR